MTIAFNITPLQSDHKVRGIGSYTRNLLNSLKARTDIRLIEFTDPSKLNDKVDLIHYPWFDLFFHTLPIWKKYPTIVTIHDLIPLNFPEGYPVGIKGWLNSILQKISLRGCKYIITDSNCSKKDIVKHLKIPEWKIHSIHLAADPAFRVLSLSDQLRVMRKYSLPNNFILYVGDVNYVKNLPFLIKGFKKIKEDSSVQDIKLVLVGSAFLKNVENIDHPELKNIKEVFKLINQFNLGDDVVRLGQIDLEDLVSIYNLATVYVQPSLYEGFGIPVLEAMACGTPIVSSNAASLPEVGGDAAVYFDPKNIDQMVTLLKEVLINTALRNKLSKMGLVQAGKFNWEKVADQTIKVYEKVK